MSGIVLRTVDITWKIDVSISIAVVSVFPSAITKAILKHVARLLHAACLQHRCLTAQVLT